MWVINEEFDTGQGRYKNFQNVLTFVVAGSHTIWVQDMCNIITYYLVPIYIMCWICMGNKNYDPKD